MVPDVHCCAVCGCRADHFDIGDRWLCWWHYAVQLPVYEPATSRPASGGRVEPSDTRSEAVRIAAVGQAALRLDAALRALRPSPAPAAEGSVQERYAAMPNAPWFKDAYVGSTRRGKGQ